MTATAPSPAADPSASAAWRATPAGTAGGLRVLGFLLERLPLRVAYVLVWPLVLMWFIHYNRPRLAVKAAMRRMGRRWILLSALRAYLEYAYTLVERYYLMAGRLRPTVEREGAAGYAVIEEAVADEGPLVFLGGHCGALEFGALALEELGRPVRAVAVRDPGSGALLAGVGDPAQRVGADRDTIVADGSIRSGLKMLKALRAGEILCFKADRVLPGDDEFVTASFFGADAPFPRGPSAIAITAKARAVVVSVFRVGPARYRVHATRLPLEGDAEAVTRRYAAALEAQLREAPHHWFNFYPYWPEDRSEAARHPEIVPLAARASEHALWGGVAASTALVGADRVLGDGLLWAIPGGADALHVAVGAAGAVATGLIAGIVALVVGIVHGAEKRASGERNGVAHLQGLLGPLLALAVPALLGQGLVSASPGSLAALGLAAAVGAIVGWFAPRVRGVGFAVVALLLAAAAA